MSLHRWLGRLVCRGALSCVRMETHSSLFASLQLCFVREFCVYFCLLLCIFSLRVTTHYFVSVCWSLSNLFISNSVHKLYRYCKLLSLFVIFNLFLSGDLALASVWRHSIDISKLSVNLLMHSDYFIFQEICCIHNWFRLAGCRGPNQTPSAILSSCIFCCNRFHSHVYM